MQAPIKQRDGDRPSRANAGPSTTGAAITAAPATRHRAITPAQLARIPSQGHP
ncbi:hypothetical protein XCR_2313 [Xanthomonas campestris pv. raphani 756C]|nr:hypothetical protein XCR_2313 [Xanthomonas campestris pv. raphani 756C]